MQQENGVVQRDRKLQDGRHGERNVRDLAQHQVRSHVQQNGNANGQQEIDRLKPRCGRHHQQEQNERHQNEERVYHFGNRHRFRLGSLHGFARNVARFAHNLVDSVYGLRVFIGIDGHAEQGVSVFIIAFN